MNDTFGNWRSNIDGLLFILFFLYKQHDTCHSNLCFVLSLCSIVMSALFFSIDRSFELTYVVVTIILFIMIERWTRSSGLSRVVKVQLPTNI
jgi:hypothetical protein